MELNNNKELPLNQFTFFSEKTGVVSRSGPPISETKLIDGEKGKFFTYSDNGRYLLIVELSQVRIISSDTFLDHCVLPIAGVTHAHFSPLSSYVVTWQRPNKELTEDNLKIWTIDGVIVMGWKQRQQLYWPMIQWSSDEMISGVLLQIGKVSFFAGSNFSTPVQNISIGGVSMFSISTGKSPYKVAVVIPQKQSTPGSLNIFSYPKVDKPYIVKTFQGDSVDISWNSLGSALLMVVNQDIDRTGKSYYGKKGLFFISAAGNFESRVTAESIHDVKWNPNGKEFAVVYGNMPNTKITIFDLKCQKVVDLGDTGEARNTLYYDPKGRILCAGGFGAINGNMDFWDLSSDNIVKIDSTNAFSSSYHEWSPDGYHFLTGVVAPRMRQDNGIKIFNYHGELIYKEDIPELFAVHWRPQNPDLFPVGPLVPPDPNATKIAPLNAPKPYRHPNFSGAAPTTAPPTTQPAKSTPTRFTPGGPARPKPGGTLVGGELDDTPAPEPVKAPPKKSGPPQTPNTPQQTPQTASPSPPVVTHHPQPPHNPSNNPPHNPSNNPPHNPSNNPPHNPSNNPPHNKPYPTSNPNPYNPQSRKERPYQTQQHQPYKKGPPRNKDTESTKEKSGGNTQTTAHNNNNNLSESEKRRRTLIKKMREIQNLKQKQAAGETLLPAQLAKIASESQIQADLDSLPKSETSEVKTPRQ